MGPLDIDISEIKNAQESAKIKENNNKNNDSKENNLTINLGAMKPRRGTAIGGSGATVRYPNAAEIQGDTDYVSIDFYKYDPPFGKGYKQKGSTGKGNNEGGTSGQYNTYNASVGDNLAKTKDTRYKSIILFMPEDVQAQYGANWGAAGFGMGQQAVARMIGMEDGPARAWGNTWEMVRAGLKNSGYELTKDVMNLATGGNLTGNQLMGGVSGTIVNPNVELMYEAPELRGFNLNFKMMARSKGEAQSIKLICQQLKKAMLPNWGGQTKLPGMNAGSGSLITIPNIVKVAFMKGNGLNKYVSQFKPCAITNVNVNYTPDGSYSTYEDGSPVATALTVQFKELKLVFSEEVNLNHNEASY